MWDILLKNFYFLIIQVLFAYYTWYICLVRILKADLNVVKYFEHAVLVFWVWILLPLNKSMYYP